MATLLLAEIHADKLNDATAKALTAARALGAPVHILCAGHGAAAAAAEAAKLEGVEKVLVAADASVEHGLAEPLAALIVSLAGGYDTILAPATSSGKNVLPRAAALLDVMQVSDVTAILAPDTFKRPVYAGNAIEVVQAPGPVRVLTIRTASFAPAASGTAPVPVVPVDMPAAPDLSVFRENLLSVSDRPDLSSAKIVVSGGRALGSKERFEQVINPLADKLGAAVGASRAAVDAGYAANDFQVGQTGKVVAPDLYIACGISGAIQHLAGMKDSRIIVAINTDAEAPIFQVADYGIVGDIFDVLPELERAL